MHVPLFIDRKEEIKILDNAWSSRPCLIVIYGRRRIGKTRLVLEWCKNRKVPCIYFHALPAKHNINLSELANAIESQAGLKGFSKAMYSSLDSLLELFSSSVKEAVLILDEFTYWVRGDPRVAGELQRFVDHMLPQTRLMIIVVGSLVGVMYRGVLGGGAPLYGRAKYRVKLAELDPWHLPLFHPWFKKDDIIRIYSLLGGVPYYHSLIGYGWNIDEVVDRLFLSPGASLRDEVLFLLREEFRDPSTYYSILKTIAQGASTPSAIADLTGIHRQHVSKYLHILEQLGFVKRERILFSSKSRYGIGDRVVETWFRLIEPIISMGIGETVEGIRRVKSSLEIYVAKVFEEIAQRYVEWLAKENRIYFDEIGRYIHKNIEIDIVALDHRNRVAHIFEVKWSDLSEVEAASIAHETMLKAVNMPLDRYTYKIYIIAKSYRGEVPQGFKVITLSDMTFHTNQ